MTVLGYAADHSPRLPSHDISRCNDRIEESSLGRSGCGRYIILAVIVPVNSTGSYVAVSDDRVFCRDGHNLRQPSEPYCCHYQVTINLSDEKSNDPADVPRMAQWNSGRNTEGTQGVQTNQTKYSNRFVREHMQQ